MAQNCSNFLKNINIVQEIGHILNNYYFLLGIRNRKIDKLYLEHLNID